MTLTTEKISEILEGAPDNSAIYDGTGLYFDQYGNHLHSDGLWSTYDAQPMNGRNLSDLREILTLRQRVEELEQELVIHKRHTELVGSLTHYMVKRGIGRLGECCTTEIVRVYEELKAQQSEVAARAVEGFADYFAVNYGEGEGFDRAIRHVKIKAREQANQLRKGEGDE